MKGMLLYLCVLASFAHGDEFTDSLKKLRADGNQEKIAKFIDESREKQKDNPDYYAASSNYWWEAAARTVISKKPAGPGDFPITREEGGEAVGSIGTTTDPESQAKALGFVKEGYRKFPLRLDLGFGLAWVQSESGHRGDAVATVKAILKTAKENKNKPDAFKWMDNGPLPEPAATFIPESIQGYTAPLFRQDTPEADAMCKELCLATIEVYPDHPFAYNILAAEADAHGDKSEALRLLKLASEKDPEDELVLHNLARAYRQAKQNGKAGEAYRRMLKLELDEDTKAEVEAALEELKKDSEKK